MLHGRLSRGIGEHRRPDLAQSSSIPRNAPDPKASFHTGGMKPRTDRSPEGTLLLIRHGIAVEPGFGLADADRPLTEEGWTRTRAAMKGLLKAGWLPDAACTSPYRRAAETLACLQEAVLKAGFHAIPSDSWAGLRPEGDCAAAEAWFRARLGAAEPGHVLAVFSHQPFLGDLARRLCGVNLEIKKASCTVVAWQGDGWVLCGQFSPSDLRALA